MHRYKNRMDGLKMAFVFVLFCFASANGRQVKKKVCIVGAGLSGIVATKYFSQYPREFKVITFDKNSNVGGLWIYTDSTTVDEHGLPVHSSMYRDLRSNSVKENMIFADYPYFGDESTDGRFIKHEFVLEYLRNYTNHFNLRQFIKLNTNIEKIKPLPHLRWLIESRNLNDNKTSETTCDIAIVCNGHNFKGYVPKIPGIENFSGQVLHSHIYRKPEAFANKTVVVLGASISGRDISVDISTLAAKVYLSSRHKKLNGKFTENIEQVPGVVGAERDKFILSNGTKIPADAFVYCTGYMYDYSFLDKNSGIYVNKRGKQIHSIYKQMINVRRPSMAFSGIPPLSMSFELADRQGYYLLQVYRGKVKLPSQSQMLLESEMELAKLPANKAPISSFHTYFKYYDDITRDSGAKPLPWWVRASTYKISDYRIKDPVYYRYKRLVIHENNRTVELV